MGKKKKDGKIFTPKDTATRMLHNVLGWDNLKYENGYFHWPNIRKHIIDNSCGDGAFLSLIVDFYIHNVSVTTRRNKQEIKELLETYIHGIELDPSEHQKCIERLDRVAALDGIKGVKWDIKNCDALSCHDYDGKMDFVIANPPYIRTHNLECDLSGYSFTEEGMKDIYLAFYELGFRMLNETGKMCYITPSSWFTSGAGQKMRDYIMEKKNLVYIEDYGHYQLFENATTYVAITLFDEKENTKVKYVTMERTNDDDGFWCGEISVQYEDMNIDGKFYFSVKSQLDKMREITDYGKNLKKEDKAFEVKNGFATLADDVFIQKDNHSFDGTQQNVIPVVKSSTGKQEWCYYPYDKSGNLLEEKDVNTTVTEALGQHRGKLEARATTEPWYAFGRTQAINDTFNEKIAVSSLVRNIYDVKLVEAGPGVGVYGGLYILPKKQPQCGIMNFIVNRLQNPEFFAYVKLLGKYKSGGYYTFSSKELENYLNWCYGKKKD